MERDKEKFKPLLLKLAIPLALTLAGSIISTITITSRTTRRKAPPNSSSMQKRQSDAPKTISQDEFGDDEGSQSHCNMGSASLSFDGGEEPLASRHSSASPEILRIHRSESMREISLTQFHDGPSLEDEIVGIKSLAVALQDREIELEQQFHHYCNMKEQESMYQKLQIICLGLKIESLESQNQRLEGTMAKFRGAIEQLDLMRAEIRLLQRKVKKLSRMNRAHSRIIQQQASVLHARENELSTSNEELQCKIEEIKRLADLLHIERKVMEEERELRASMDSSTPKSKREVAVTDDADRTRLDNDRLLALLEHLHNQWSADIEELIYLGWIKACLRQELSRNQEEEGKPVQEKQDELVVEPPPNDEITDCSIEFYDSDCPITVTDHGEACEDVADTKHHARSTKPRLFHKLKGWAKGKGRCRKACKRDNCSSSLGIVEDQVRRNSC